MKTIVVTDGKYRGAIAAVRALGRSGWQVIVTQTEAECGHTPPVFVSKYTAKTHWISGSCKDEGYAQRLLEVLEQYDHPALLCVGADTLNLVSRERQRFEAVCSFLIASPQALDDLNDKETVHRRCQELGLPVPRQYEGAPEEYPVVIKPHCGEKFGLKARDRYAVAQNEEEFRLKYAAMQRYDDAPIVQQQITGSGSGACLLIDREGRLISALCHRRIREYPVTGGPSTCCMSFYDETMIASAYALLRSFSFVGLAMVEFKGDCILEVNPRIWGSFPMTDCAKSPFIVHYAAAAAGEQVSYQPQDYETGVKMRFVLNDTVATLHYFKAGRWKEGFGGVADALRAREALWDRDDPKPFWQYLKVTL